MLKNKKNKKSRKNWRTELSPLSIPQTIPIPKI